MLRSIGKQSGESVESVRKKTRKATVGRIWEGGFKPGEWMGDEWWEWRVDWTDWESATQRIGWVTIVEISACLTEGSQELILETREAWWKEWSVIRGEDDVDGRASVTKDEKRVFRGGWTVMTFVGCEYFVGNWEELVFNALSYL